MGDKHPPRAQAAPNLSRRRVTERAWPAGALGGAPRAAAWLPLAPFGTVRHVLAPSWHPCSRLMALLWLLARP